MRGSVQVTKNTISLPTYTQMVVTLFPVWAGIKVKKMKKIKETTNQKL